MVNTSTGEEIIAKKFYKSDFGDVWKDPEYSKYVDALLEACLVRKMQLDENIDIDVDSYSEVSALADDLGLQDELSI